MPGREQLTNLHSPPDTAWITAPDEMVIWPRFKMTGVDHIWATNTQCMPSFGVTSFTVWTTESFASRPGSEKDKKVKKYISGRL